MPPDAADHLSAARALAPAIRERRAEIESGRRVPQDLIEQLRIAGLFHLVVPRDLGGIETDPVTASRVVEEIAAADASAGWCVMLAHQTAGYAGFMEPAAAREVWGDGGIAAGTARPIGRAIPVTTPEPGYVVSGRWPFASGSSHADWFGGECIVYDGDAPRHDTAGEPVIITAFVPRAQTQLFDTWDTTGLRGTASNDFEFEGVFVPARRAMQFGELKHPWPVYKAAGLIFMNHGAHALGVARAAIESAREIMTTRRGWGNTPLREVPRIQHEIAEAIALVESARAFLYNTASLLLVEVDAGNDDTALLRARLRLAAAHAASASVQAVDILHRGLATSSIMVGTPLEQEFRDLRTAAAHVMIGPMVYEAAGRVELGLEADFPFF